MKSIQIDPPLACTRDGDAFHPEQRNRYEQILERLRQEVQDVGEVADGYAIAFEYQAALFLLLAEFITLERRCCRFLDFSLELESAGQRAALTLTGGRGVKEFLRSELNLLAE